jgi:hypothetical protein
MSVQTDIIIPALQDLGVAAAGEIPSSTDLNDGLALVNLVLDQWSAEQLTVPVPLHTTFNLAANTDTYAMGPAATWSTAARPVRIIGGVAFSGAFRHGLEVVPLAQFRQRCNAANGLRASLPDLLAHDNALSAINAFVFPMPNAASSLTLDYWSPLAAFAALTDGVTLPPAAKLALRFALAIAWAPTQGKEVGQTLASNAQNAKASLVQLNAAIIGAAEPPQPAQ